MVEQARDVGSTPAPGQIYQEVFIMNRKILALTLAACMAVSVSGCSSIDRGMKSLRSDFNGGLHRTVTVYDYNGNIIKSYSGKFDVSESENEVYFDIDDKRVIIHGGIVIDEEN